MKTYTISTIVKNKSSAVLEDDMSFKLDVKSIKFSYNTNSGTLQNPKIDIAVNNKKITEKPIFPCFLDFEQNDKALFSLEEGDNVVIEVSNLDNTIEQQIDITFIGD